MIKWCIEHKLIVVLFSILLIASGAFAYTDLERQENPTITPPIALVQCIYPGASPEDIEKEVIKKIEDKIGTIEGIKTIESFSLDSVGIVKITLEDMSDAEILRRWDKLRDKVDAVKTDLPEAALAPTIDTELSNSYGLVIGISSEDYTNQDLKRVAKNLEQKIKVLDGVAEVKIVGEIEPSIEIQIDMVKLKQYNIAPNMILTAIQSRNVNIPGGNLNLEKSKIPVQITGEYKDIESLRKTIVGISSDTGIPISIGDLSTVISTEKEPDSYSLVGQDKAIVVGVRFSNGQNVLKAAKKVDETIKVFKANDLYKNMKLTILNDQPTYVSEAINLFVDNLLSAVVLVIIVVWLFMGMRSAIIVSVPIVIVTAVVLIYMKMTGIPLHQISIAALIISLSLLVANGIVANDNMYLYLQQGKERRDAMTTGVRDVSIPILTSTLTTIASFLPLAMMQGSAGKFASALPLLVSVALIASYLTALTLVPVLGDKILEVKSRKGGVLAHLVHALKIDQLGHKLMKFYDFMLSKALLRPKTTIAIFVVLLGMSMTLVPSLGIQVFPPIQRDQYVMSVRLPSGVNLDYTRDISQKIGHLIESDPSTESVAAQVGEGFIQYYDTFDAARQGTNVAEFIINGERAHAEAMAQQVRKTFPELTVTLKFLELSMPQDQPVQVRISGSDIKTLKAIAESVEKSIKPLKGVLRTEINYGHDSYKLKVNVDETKANLSGISNYDVAATVRMAVNGLEITKLKQADVDQDPIPVNIRIGKAALRSISDLDQIFLTSQLTGENVPLGQIAKITTEASFNQIVRRNEIRTITVGLYLKPDASSDAVLLETQNALKQYELPKDYQLSYGGDNEFADETFGSMVVPAIMAVGLIYLIIALQFGSLLEPLIIMGTIPLSFIGIFSGLKIMNYPIGFMAMLGAISLMGVVVNNGIVLLDYIKLLQKNGYTLDDAVKKGAETRLRPIMIGMVTTVISLLPLMFSGGPLWQPLAAALNFGMVVSTVLTLIVIPCSYIWIERMRKKYKIRFEN